MSFQHRLEYLGYLVGGAIARGLPSRIVDRGARALARTAFDRGGRRVRYAQVNLRVAFPELTDEQRDEIGRESWVQTFHNFIDVWRGEKATDQDVRDRVSLHGFEHLERALERGNGVFGLGLHMGSFEFAMRRLSLEVPATVVGRPLKNSLIYARLVAQRTRSGGKVLHHKRAVVGIQRALKRGGFVAIFNDQYSRRSRGVEAPLFGARCSTGAGLAILALRGEVPVVPFYAVRDGPDRHSVYFQEPLRLEIDPDREANIVAATTEYNAALERIIRRHPEHWMWSHRRFRHSPDLPDGLYS